MNNQETTGAPADGMAFPPFYGQQTPFPYVLVPFPQQYAQYPPCLMYQNGNFCGPPQMLPSAGHISQQVYQQPTGQYATGQMPPQAPMQPSSNTGNSQTVNTVLVPGNGGSQQILVDKSELERLREELRDSKIRIAVLESTERFYRANNSKSSSPKTNQVAVSHNVIPQEKITAKETTMETTHQSSSSAENMSESTVVALPLDVFPALEANINNQGSVQKEITHETITATQALILRESMAENLVATPPLVDFPALGILIKSQEPGQKDIKSVESSAPLSYASVAKKCSNAISLPQPLSPKPQHCMTTISIKMDPVPNLPRSPGRKPVFSDKSTSRCTTKSSFENTLISKKNQNDDSNFIEVKTKSRGSTAKLAPLSGNTKWVDRDQVYKKYNKKARQESSKSTVVPTAEVSESKSAEIMEKEAKYDVLGLAEELVQIPFNPKKPKNKKKNKNKKNKKESPIETENGDFEMPNDVDEKKPVDEKAKNKKSKDALLNRHQKMVLLKSYKETIASYSETIRILRCFHLGFKKERPLLHPFQMVILDHLETSSPFNLTGRRAKIEEKVAERTRAYNKEFHSESDRMSAFITAICNGNFVMDDVINADLLFLYDNELEEGLVREKEKKYFEMIVNFNQWKPNSTSQHLVLSEDLLRIPVSLDITHIRSFAYQVYIQTMARVNNDNTSFNTNVMNEIDQDIIKAYKVFQNEKLAWTLGDCQAFLKTRLEYHKSLPKDALSEKNIKFFEFLLHVTSGVLNFDVFWFYHVPPGSGSLDDAILDEMFIQHLFHQFA